MKYFLIFLFFLFSSSIIFAGNDLIIICSENSICTKSSELPLFNENNLYPGSSISQNLKIVNLKNQSCNLNINTPQNIPLANKFYLTIENDSTILYSDTLVNLSGSTPLGVIDPESQDNYVWALIFDRDSFNNHQNISTVFNLDFDFICDDEPTNILGTSIVRKVNFIEKHKKLLAILSVFILMFNFIFNRFFHKKIK